MKILVFFIGLFFSLFASSITDRLNSRPLPNIRDFSGDVNKMQKAQAEKKNMPLTQTATAQKKQTSVKENTQNTVSYSVLKRLETLKTRLETHKNSYLPNFRPARPLFPSDKDESLINLREILEKLGYLDPAEKTPFYDMALETAVRWFQRSHCIKADGVIREDTVACANWPISYRLKLVEKTMDAVKNMKVTNKSVILNVPTYRLHLFEGPTQKFSMKVIVGRSTHPTPSESTKITAITIHPTWVVPEDVMFNELLGQIQENSDILKKMQITIHAINTQKQIEPKQINWQQVNRDNFPFYLFQNPGPFNPMGNIKFDLDKDNLYLHDTPDKSLFENARRDLGFRYPRVEYANVLAAWMLDQKVPELLQVIQRQKTIKFNVPKQVNVHITYLPVWAEEDAEVFWGSDPYGSEEKPS